MFLERLIAAKATNSKMHFAKLTCKGRQIEEGFKGLTQITLSSGRSILFFNKHLCFSKIILAAIG